MRQAVRARVNLGPGKTTVETLNEREVRTWGGERGLALPVLASRLTRETDPLSPENTLVVAAGLLNGLAFPGTCRYGVYAKSPLTGGSFGPAMRAQGIDAIVLEGASERPVYLWVENGSVTVHDASDLWGKPNRETLEALTARHGAISALLVGPAGEKLVRYACVINDLRHANGRTGMGAVFGSKRVKAVAAPAPKAIPPVVPERLKEAHVLFVGWKENPLSWALRETGTPAAVGGLNALGSSPPGTSRTAPSRAPTGSPGRPTTVTFWGATTAAFPAPSAASGFRSRESGTSTPSTGAPSTRPWGPSAPCAAAGTSRRPGRPTSGATPWAWTPSPRG